MFISGTELSAIISAAVDRAKAEAQLADAKKVLLEQAELLNDYNKRNLSDSENIRKNTDTLMQIYSYVSNL